MDLLFLGIMGMKMRRDAGRWRRIKLLLSLLVDS